MKYLFLVLSFLLFIPDDIMQYPMAACSQQSIVLMEFFRKKSIPYRKIGFDHYFELEGFKNTRMRNFSSFRIAGELFRY